MVHVLYEDKDILVVRKPAGIDSQTSRSFEPDMVSEIKNYLRLSTKLTGNSSTGREPYVGVIHRLDRPVEGVMVYARTPAAAKGLSSELQKGNIDKTYHALVCGKPVDNSGTLVDFLLKNGKTNTSEIVDKSVEGAKRAELKYKVLDTVIKKDLIRGTETECTRLEIELLTGRHHQIRVQMAGAGMPLYGDSRYNPAFAGKAEKPALCSVRLAFKHPVTGKRMEFEIKETF